MQILSWNSLKVHLEFHRLALTRPADATQPPQLLSSSK